MASNIGEGSLREEEERDDVVELTWAHLAFQVAVRQVE
jgi:hypothetical protein